MRGYECYECGGVTEAQDFDPATDVCGACGSDNVAAVEIFPCPLSDTSHCEDEAHHWGLGKHVVTQDES